MANLIRVIGVGPGNPDYVTPEARKLMNGADILVGGERLLRQFGDSGKESFIIKNNLAEMAEFIKSRRQNRVIAVLASGDPSFYGILEFLKRHFDKTELVVSPGLSSAQVACARLCISWHDAAFYSVHGRDLEGLAELVRAKPKVIILTDPVKTPAVIATDLVKAGVQSKRMYVCESISYDDERIIGFDIDKVPADVGESGCVVVITDE